LALRREPQCKGRLLSKKKPPFVFLRRSVAENPAAFTNSFEGDMYTKRLGDFAQGLVSRPQLS
jgi:hypothetical protein